MQRAVAMRMDEEVIVDMRLIDIREMIERR